MLDNEYLAKFKAVLKEYEVEYELDAPNQHWRNAVECTIRKFKNHFRTGLVTCDLHFPLPEWYGLVVQGGLTLNSL